MFHLRNGWYFNRLDDGMVQIIKRADAHENAPIVAEVIIAAWEWASVVAAVSGNGEATETYQDALRLHGREDLVAHPALVRG